MILTGSEIKKNINEGRIRINPFNEESLQPNSYDLTLASDISYYTLIDNIVTVGQIDKDMGFEQYGMSAVRDIESQKCGYNRSYGYLDSKGSNTMITDEIPDDGFILLPGVLYLVHTNEKVWSDEFVPEVSGSSSLARLGLKVHQTAGYANLGHDFHWVLELEAIHPIKIYKGMKIGQMYFFATFGDKTISYNGIHRGQE